MSRTTNKRLHISLPQSDASASLYSGGNSDEDRELADVLRRLQNVFVGSRWTTFDGGSTEEAEDFLAQFREIQDIYTSDKLLDIVKSRLKGQAAKWYGAYENDEIIDYTSFKNLFITRYCKKAVLEDKYDTFIHLYVEGPAGDDILGYAYDLKRCSPKDQDHFKRSRLAIGRHVPEDVKEKISKVESWLPLLSILEKDENKICSYLNQCLKESVSDSEQLHVDQDVEEEKGTEAPTGTMEAFIAKRKKRKKKKKNCAIGSDSGVVVIKSNQIATVEMNDVCPKVTEDNERGYCGDLRIKNQSNVKEAVGLVENDRDDTHHDILARDFGELKSFQHQQSPNENKVLKTGGSKLIKEPRVSVQHNKVNSCQEAVHTDKFLSVCETDPGEIFFIESLLNLKRLAYFFCEIKKDVAVLYVPVYDFSFLFNDKKMAEMTGKNQEHEGEEGIATGRYVEEIKDMPVGIPFKPWTKQVNSFKIKSCNQVMRRTRNSLFEPVDYFYQVLRFKIKKRIFRELQEMTEFSSKQGRVSSDRVVGVGLGALTTHSSRHFWLLEFWRDIFPPKPI